MSGKKILIVDDDEHLLLGLTCKLKANGYAVFSAMDGITAVAVARKELPDLVLLDLGLPGGDGFLVLERLRAMTELVATPVIVLSARDPAGEKQRVLQAGAVAFFQKPPDSRELLAAIRQALGEEVALSQFLKT
ncbi:MAG: response regulator transcription factor [Candidatus Acidiferrales bacterium]|jgi:two-component system KDP operon response regulator KdpE